jgi:hypothetical protein
MLTTAFGDVIKQIKKKKKAVIWVGIKWLSRAVSKFPWLSAPLRR